MHFTKAAKYLGVMIGPYAELQTWDEPMQKYISRSKRWAQLGIGLNWSIKMYNVFLFSVFSFKAQFYEPPQELMKEEEEHALRRLMLGPRNWIKKNQILTHSTWGGYVWDPQSLQLVALAAKYRLTVTERCLRNGDMAKEVRALHFRTDTHTFLSNGEDKWIDGGHPWGATTS
jgi:hypothetical protein